MKDCSITKRWLQNYKKNDLHRKDAPTIKKNRMKKSPISSKKRAIERLLKGINKFGR